MSEECTLRAKHSVMDASLVFIKLFPIRKVQSHPHASQGHWRRKNSWIWVQDNDWLIHWICKYVNFSTRKKNISCWKNWSIGEGHSDYDLWLRSTINDKIFLLRDNMPKYNGNYRSTQTRKSTFTNGLLSENRKIK